MAKATYYQKASNLDYVNSSGSKIEANTIIVLGDRIGIAGCDIDAGETGAIVVEGVFKMPKSSASAIAAGAEVYFDGTGITTTSSSNTRAGFAAAAAAAADTQILVSINA